MFPSRPRTGLNTELKMKIQSECTIADNQHANDMFCSELPGNPNKLGSFINCKKPETSEIAALIKNITTNSDPLAKASIINEHTFMKHSNQLSPMKILTKS